MTELGLNTGGWIFLIVAWAGILSLTVYCFRKVLGTNHKHSH